MRARSRSLARSSISLRRPTAGGYWFVADDGGIFAFGNAHFYGSTGNMRLPGPIVAMAPGPEGRGYVFAGRDGMLHPFGVQTLAAGYPVATRGGKAVLRFSSATPGKSSVGATVMATGATATSIEVRWLAGPPAQLTLPPPATTYTNQGYGVRADVRDAAGYPVDPTTVQFVATMEGGDPPPVQATTENGSAYAHYTSRRIGPMTIMATVGNLSATTRLEWVDPPPGPPPTLATAISLDPATATLGPGHIHTITATVTGEGGRAVQDGTPVTFTTSGPSGSPTICPAPVAFDFGQAQSGWILYGDGQTDFIWPYGHETGTPGDLTGAVDLAATPFGSGYWIVTADGQVRTSGNAIWFGDASERAATNPVVRVTATPSGQGYWLLHRDGAVSAFGDARSHGSVAGRALPAPAISLMATPTGAGYWIVASDGSVSAFGDAAFFGDVAGIRLYRPIVDATPTATGRGYWMVDSSGGMFAFGDAAFYGSLGAKLLPAPVTRLVRSPSDEGYHMLTRDGVIWSFGNAPTMPAAKSCRSNTVDGRATLQVTSASVGRSEITAFAHDVSVTAVVEWREGAGFATSSARAGYWMLGADGRVFAFGDAVRYGEATIGADIKAVDLEPTPARLGYWIVDSNGVVHTFGDAKPFGNADPRTFGAGETISSLSSSPTGRGYWIFTSRGRVMPFGDARFFGDTSAMELNGPVLDSIPTPSGAGYYMVASDGGIFAFGDARFAGSMGGRPLNKPVQSLVPDRDGSGYWLVASDGGIFAFDAPFRGSMGDRPLNKPVTGMVRYGDGYLMVATDGGIFAFSDKPFAGSLGANPPAQPIVSVAATG